MELHRNHGSLVVAFLFTIGGTLVLALGSPQSVPGWVAWAVIGGGSVLFGLYALVVGLRRFRFAIGPTGLDVHTEYLRRELSWTEIQELSLETAKPWATSDKTHPILFGTLTVVDPDAANSHAERLKLLDLADVREDPAEVAAALAQYAGDLFVDARALAAPKVDFTVVLRGFDRPTVDSLIQQSAAAQVDADRVRAVDCIDEFLATPLVVGRGYDREQVRAYLEELRADLRAQVRE